MARLLRRLAAAFALACSGAHAVPMSPDPTGFWYLPSESGWGAAIAQQGEVLFAALFVYDPQGRPAWLVAPDVTDTGNGVFSGTLYRTSGPWFGGPFDPGLAEHQAVGILRVRYAVNFGGQASLRLGYTVDGVAVTKAVVRQTWGSNATRLPGAYFGGASLAPAPFPQPARCATAPAYFSPGGAIRINMAEPDTIAIIGDEALDTRSVIGGTYLQSGQLGVITGSLFAGPVAFPPALGEAQVANLAITDDGFSGHLRLMIDNCVYEGAIGGIRRPASGVTTP